MKNLLKSVVLAAALTGLASVANAASFTTGSTALASGTQQSQDDINSLIASWASEATLLYKSTQGDNATPGAEAGAFSDSYNTTYGSLATASAVIAYDGPMAINASPVYALIKDGRLPGSTAPTWYFYDLTGWNGTDNIEFSGYFGGNQGKISHVSIYGTHIPRTNVPDAGSSVALFGLVIAGFGLVRRKLS